MNLVRDDFCRVGNCGFHIFSSTHASPSSRGGNWSNVEFALDFIFVQDAMRHKGIQNTREHLCKEQVVDRKSS